MKALVITFLSITFYLSPLQSQEGWQINGFFDFGKVPRHNPKIAVDTWRFWSSQAGIRISNRTLNDSAWRTKCNYPGFGWNLLYTVFGKQEVYGKALSIVPNIQFFLLEKSGYKLQIVLGSGLSYLSNHYRINQNNTAIGSSWNNATVMHLENTFDTGPVKLVAGIGLTHFSNAALRQPNLGLNLLHGRLGVSWSISQSMNTKSEEAQNKNNPRSAHSFGLSTSLHLGAFDYEEVQLDAISKIGTVYSISVAAVYRTGMINRIFTGIMTSYNQGRKQRNGHEAATVIGWFVGNEVLLGKMGLVLSSGVYLRQHYDPESLFYAEFRIRFYPVKRSQRVFFGIGLKTHLEVAEYPSLSIGYVF